MGLVPARRPGWLLERRGNPSPRGMAAQSRFLKRDGQNPAYRPSGTFSLNRFETSQSARRPPTRQEAMPKQKRSDDWGFPRWRSYGDKGRSAAKVHQGQCHRKHTARLRTGKVERVRQERTAVLATGPAR